MKAPLFVVMVTLALPTAALGGVPAAKATEPPLEGAWALAIAEQDNKEDTDALTRAYRVLIRGNIWAARSVGTEDEAKVPCLNFKLDAGKTPKEIDLLATKPGGEASLGIYSLDGDTLKICFARAAAARPTEFRTKPGDKRHLLTFKRLAGGPDEPTRDDLVPFLKEQFGLTIPDTAKVANFATQADPISRRRPVREAFAEITLPAEEYKAFRKRLLYDDKRPDGQRIMWEGKEKPPTIGGIPGPVNLPRSAARWWTRDGADTLCVLSNERPALPLPGGREVSDVEQTGAVVMFLSERQGRVMLWAFVAEGTGAKPAAEPAAKEIEFRGRLRVGDPPRPAPDLGSDKRVVLDNVKAPLTGVTFDVEGHGAVEVYLPDDRLTALAKELNGRRVLLTGEMRQVTVVARRSYRAAGSGLEVRGEDGKWVWVPLGGELPVVRRYVRATGVKPLDAKLEPWTGEPSVKSPFGNGEGRIFTFKRLPKAKDVTAVRLTPDGNPNQAKPLTAANFPALLDGMMPIDADHPDHKLWANAPWYKGEFETPEGRFRVTFYLGGPAVVQAPDGTRGFAKFEHPK